jgi:hypothetical protein
VIVKKKSILVSINQLKLQIKGDINKPTKITRHLRNLIPLRSYPATVPPVHPQESTGPKERGGTTPLIVNICAIWK